MVTSAAPDEPGSMTTLHIENTVHDFDSWKAAFDKFDRFRADQGVRSYRVTRDIGDPQKVTVDLDFDSPAEASAFRVALERIWQTPQSKEHLVSHSEPLLMDLVEARSC